jgi:hypothetical protein
MLRVITIPAYSYVILQVQSSLSAVAKLESAGCFASQFGDIKEWFTVEVFIFYANIFVLILYYLSFNKLAALFGIYRSEHKELKKQFFEGLKCFVEEE